MKVDRRVQAAHGIRLSIRGGSGEIARAHLYDKVPASDTQLPAAKPGP